MVKKEFPQKINKPVLDPVEPLSLTIPGVDNAPGINFPGPVVESMRYLITRVGNQEPFPSRISIVSALRQEGVTFISRALGATLANDFDSKVCVIELNWWWPSQSPLVGPSAAGLAAVIAGEISLESAVIATGFKNLSILPAGNLPAPNRPIVSRSQELNAILKELSLRFDHLILDIPAILTTSDAVPLASLGDVCCVVVRQKATSIDDIRSTLDEIAHLKILGVVMNQTHYASPKGLLKWISGR